MDALVEKMLSNAKAPEGGAGTPKPAPSSSRSREALGLAWKAAQDKDEKAFVEALDAAIEIRVLQSK